MHARTDADVPHHHSEHAHERLPVSLETGTHVSPWLGPDAVAVQAAVLQHLS